MLLSLWVIPFCGKVNTFGLLKLKINKVLALRTSGISYNKLVFFSITITTFKTEQRGKTSVLPIQKLPNTHFCPTSTIKAYL